MRTCGGRDSRWHGNTPPRGEAGRGAACWREGRRLLAESEARQPGLGRLRVLGAEGLTAFKLHALVNDPSRLLSGSWAVGFNNSRCYSTLRAPYRREVWSWLGRLRRSDRAMTDRQEEPTSDIQQLYR